MSALKSEFIQRAKRVHGFTGVAALMEDDGDQVCFVCADADVLFAKLQKFMPEADLSGAKFQKVTIIQAK